MFMKAVVVRQWGGSEQAVVEEGDIPQPGADEVLVRVRASSINPLDWKIREGYLQQYVSLPFRLGSDFAGDIEQVGDDVHDLQIGDGVYGMKGLTGGGFAHYTVAKASMVARKPRSLEYGEAAAVPHAGSAAWQALFEHGQVNPGQRVLIHAAAGGVGHFAVQFAKHAGAYVIGTASASNADFVRGLGADEVIDYNTVAFESAVSDVDLVLDTLGFDVAARSLGVIKPGGTIVGIVTPAPMDAAAARQVTSKFFGAEPRRDHLEKLAQHIDAGHAKPHVSRTLPFGQIHDGLHLSQQQHVRGKIVVRLDD
jgi:NADPH:quinone reductase-like Zn-dependent oxidoreductase